MIEFRRFLWLKVQKLAEHYLFVTCQSGMESVVKANLQRKFPAAKFSFSKPGFITYKFPSQSDSDESQIHSIPEVLGVRSWCFSLEGIQLPEPNWEQLADKLSLVGQKPTEETSKGKPIGRSLSKKKANHLPTFRLLEFLEIESFFTDLTDFEKLVDQLVQACQKFKDSPAQHFHLWFRDGLIPAGQFSSDKNFARTPKALAWLADHLTSRLIKEGLLDPAAKANQVAPKDSSVIDLCLVSPTHWWTGHHVVTTKPQRWPGGVMPISENQQPPVSRAYFKAREAFAFSGLVAKKGDMAAEIGSSPGGSCQWLLQQGLKVIGIDPADMDPQVSGHKNFVHIRRRGLEVKRQSLAGIRWLLSDANIHPDIVLDTIESLLQHPSIDPEALVLTIKPPKRQTLQDPDAVLSRIRELGYPKLFVRQLIFNRQEFCVVATR